MISIIIDKEKKKNKSVQCEEETVLFFRSFTSALKSLKKKTTHKTYDRSKRKINSVLKENSYFGRRKKNY